MISFIVNALGLLFIYLCILFGVVQVKKDISIANFGWGGGVLLLTLYTFFAFSHIHLRKIIVTACILLWALRLSYYVWLRYKKGADPRYTAWLEYWKKPEIAFLFSFLWIIILNGFFACVMASPSVVINSTINQGPFNIIDLLGLGLWILGFFFELVSDYQMYIFKQNPQNKGKILDTGLWRYSRHPNYFGEILMWWGIYILAFSVPHGWLTIIAPLGITITLLFVTGVPWAEAKMNELPGYEEYKRKTSILIPWMPKK